MKLLKYKLTLFILICMLGITGCNKATENTSKATDKDRTPDTTTEATAEPTKEPTPEPTQEPTPEPTAEPTAEPTKEPTPEPTEPPTGDLPDEIDPSLNSESSFFDLLTEVADEKSADELIAEVNESTGYMSSDSETVTALLELCELDVELLSHENIDNGTDSTFYRFEMTHNEPLVEMPSDSDLTYVTQLNHNDEIFYILFGAKENSQDIDILAQEGITIEYWALGVETGGDYLLVPIFAGNEENGYYIVRTNCEMSDFDMSETMYLSEQGVSFATNSNSGTNEPDPDTDTPNIDDPVPTTTSDDFSFEINEVVMEDGMVDIYCQLENGYGKEVYLSDETILLNGEDITDHTLFSFFVEGNSRLEDTFVITDQALSSGDTLQISFTVMDFETNTQIGTVEYSYTIS